MEKFLFSYIVQVIYLILEGPILEQTQAAFAMH
jgi:hypothetical protein